MTTRSVPDCEPMPNGGCAAGTSSPWVPSLVRIAEIIPEISGVRTYRLVAAATEPAAMSESRTPGAAYAFEPGQFNMLYVPGVGESAISMSGVAAGWLHTIREAGQVTQAMADLRVGDTLGCRGPYGVGWPMNELSDEVIIVAGGLGLAPLRPLIHAVARERERFAQVSLIIGARTPDALLYTAEYAGWAAAGINVQVTVDRAGDDWTGQVGVVTNPLDRLELQNPAQACLVTCGPEVMMKYVVLTGRRRGLTLERMWVSLERHMQCALGWCGHCQLGPAFICKDGPVLRADRIQPFLAVEGL